MKKELSWHRSTPTGSQGLRLSRNPLQDSIILQEDVEEQLPSLVEQIEKSKFFVRGSRHVRIRLESWLQALQRHQFNSVWRANKLNYLKLLSLMCHCEALLPPFTNFPQHPTPLLHKHEIDRIIDEVEKQVRNSKLNTKRHHHTHSHVEHNVRRNHVKQNQLSRYKQGKGYEGKENTRAKKGEEKVEMQQVTKKKHEFKSNQRSLEESNFSTKQPTVAKSMEMREKLRSKAKTESKKSANLPFDGLLEKRVRDGSGYIARSPCRQKQNSISDSVSLQLSPVLVSSKVWEFTHKKAGNGVKHPKHAFDLSQLMRTTIECKKQRAYHHLTLSEDQYSTGEVLRMPKQYWESNTYTANATPKYLNSFKHMANLSFTESEDYENLPLEGKTCCECPYPFWSNL